MYYSDMLALCQTRLNGSIDASLRGFADDMDSPACCGRDNRALSEDIRALGLAECPFILNSYLYRNARRS